MDYRDYKTLDFATDDYFITWVKTPDEQNNDFWNSFLKENEHKAAEVKQAKRLILAMNTKPITWDLNRQAMLKKRVMANVNAQTNRSNFSLKRTILRRVAIVASACTAVAACFLISIPVFSEQATFKTGKNQTKEIVLPDGSSVVMNANTSLSYQRNWWSSKRNTELNGEAFFKVKHDDHSVFTVHYGKLYAKVLGTSFNIKAYNDLSEARVTVISGKVEVGDMNGKFDLITPNKENIYQKKTDKHLTRLVDAQKVANWSSNEINLFDVPFSEMIFTLENLYNVKIDCPQSILDAADHTTIHFKKTDKIENALGIICLIHNLDYKINKPNHITLSVFKPKQQPSPLP
ncbi:FecR family protein [Pedobacter sp. SL55]|uniref:FecR family protein n=1 Tax=Pedobacter sp. SL55 TaxID=2995161 RepID=UPI00226F8C80|nr:FecR family protein [Pedobacter sp. SL55]WAC40389.1 FecR family protein [Pedobacter sp. SL55]